mmetsp:Transcript_40796/g.96065  ORF Transcript_40796/g.96065 Transcript_40796/m.96065 type:complete len:84 (+) Transcript_40796:1729-1980(+)
MVILTQPLAIVWAARHIGDRDNLDLLFVSECLAAVTSVVLLAALLQGVFFEQSLIYIKSSDFCGLYGMSSCSWIGEHYHLHWV